MQFPRNICAVLKGLLYLCLLKKIWIMTENVEFSENVLLVDVACFNEVVTGMRHFFGMQLGRPLQDIYVEEWATCLALDAGVRNGDNEIEVVFVHDGREGRLQHCDPSDLAKELNGVGFSSQLGELAFVSVSPEGFASRENLYLELLQLALGSARVKRVMLVPSMGGYGTRLLELLAGHRKEAGDEKAKEVILFSMDKPAGPLECKWDLLGYSVMRALGIRAEELR